MTARRRARQSLRSTASPPRGPEAEAETRLLSFVNDHASIEHELHADGTTVAGQIMPASTALLLVEPESSDTLEVATYEFGRFRFSTPAGPIRIRVVGVVIAPWITR